MPRQVWCFLDKFAIRHRFYTYTHNIYRDILSADTCKKKENAVSCRAFFLNKLLKLNHLSN